MTAALLGDAWVRRRQVHGSAPSRLTGPQQAVIDSPYRVTLTWGANGVGKSVILAEKTTRALEQSLHWQRRTGRPPVVMLTGNTWKQLASTLGYFFAGRARAWFREGVRFESGMVKGQRMAVYDLVAGPGRGGTLVCGTFRAENLAGWRADWIGSDEPLPEAVFNELYARLLGRNGRMDMFFTPTLGTSTKVDYLWAKVDDPSLPEFGEIQIPLTLDAVTPRGGLIESPWMTQAEIDQFASGLSAIERDMRLGLTRTPRLDTAYFSAWGPHCIADADPPGGTPLGIGIDHGSRPGAQRAVLAAVGGRGLRSRAWIIDEYKGNGRTRVEDDARGILDMIERHGYGIEDIDLWVGDRAHHGDRRGGFKSNDRLKTAMAQALGHDTTRRGWSQKLPKALQYMKTPRKYDRSVWEGCEILHRMMVGDSPRLLLSSRCDALASDLATWQGAKLDPSKDGIDALRYVVVPMVEGRSR